MGSKQSSTVDLKNNSRFYVLVTSILISLIVLFWARITFASDQLYGIRLQQLYGALSVLYLYIALLISPVSKLVDEKSFMKQVLFARRAIGVSAAYFAVLHSTIALFGQIGGIDGLVALPARFKWSVAFGAFTLIVLLMMAATSFDKVIGFMTLSRWKLLHRLIYIGAVLVVLHIWMIGTHMASLGVVITCFITLMILTVLESVRIGRNLAKHFPEQRITAMIITFVISLVIGGLLLSLPRIVNNQHTEHHQDHVSLSPGLS